MFCLLFVHLSEEVPGQLLLQHSFLSDEVEQVLAGLGPLHHNNEGVVSFKVIDEADHARDSTHTVHQTNLQRHLIKPNL